MIPSPQSAVLGLDPSLAHVAYATALVSPLARHFDSIFTAARQLMKNQGAQSMSDLVSTHQFVTNGPFRSPQQNLLTGLHNETA